MSNSDHWQEANDHYLASALTWLRLRLQRQIVAADFPDSELQETAATLSAAETADPPAAILLLCQRFGLSRFERDVLLLCAAMELDTRIADLCSQAQHDPNRPYPTFALALSLFDEPTWDALSPERPLRFWHLLEINPAGADSFASSPLRADPRIVSFLKGLNYLDERLTALLSSVAVGPRVAPLPVAQEVIVQRVLGHLESARESRLPAIHLLGADAAGKLLLAGHVVARLGLHLFRLPVEWLPNHLAELETLARLWQRESMLLPIALYLDAHALEKALEGPASFLERFLTRIQGICFLDTRDKGPNLATLFVAFEVDKPAPEEQRQAWAAALSASAAGIPGQLAGQFNLSLSAIQDIARTVRSDAAGDESVLQDKLWDACLEQTRPRLDQLAQRLDAKATWEDLVLPAAELALLRQIAAQVRQRGTVYESWGFRRRMNRGFGVSVLFAGESGTGKTMAAEVIARDLRLHLYRIDLSAVVSKYIGETEKNLRRLFDAAEDGGAILFFDEADALFGKRSEVKDSHDRYANIEINYLLQRMEGYRGLAILATNMKSALDSAFLRRLRFLVNFPFPGPAERLVLWQKVFPAETPKEGLDFDRLTRLNLTGGSIHNIALNAAFLAAEAGSAVTMPLVLDAARAEFRKLERPINEVDFRI